MRVVPISANGDTVLTVVTNNHCGETDGDAGGCGDGGDVWWG